MHDPILWTLISIQVFMGAFDTLVHHEGTERLAWRASQKTELRLHGVRNLFYAFIFLCFGWLEPHGIYTIILVTILGVEVLITLWDFVEEDMTRKLPATERVNHTLLALNYGAILALAAPVLYQWSMMISSLTPTHYGWWSAMASVSAIGVGVFGVRDLLAANRSERLIASDAKQLLDNIGERKSVLITGATGFIGTRLVESLVANYHKVTIVTRKKENAEHLAHPVQVLTNFNQIRNDDVFDVVINLAGDAVAGGLWTKAKRARLINSRVETTAKLIAVIKRLEQKPECLINGSAIGWYGLRDDEDLTENEISKDCFTHQICEAWECEANKAKELGLRVVTMRIGLVLGVEGGMMAKLLTPFEFALGGAFGNGKQWMSWIALDDMVRAIGFVAANKSIEGPVNMTAPKAARNEDFTKALGSALNRPTVFRVPAIFLSTLLGDLARETMLGGQKVIPEKLCKAGFKFRHIELEDYLKTITGAVPIAPVSKTKAYNQVTT